MCAGRECFRQRHQRGTQPRRHRLHGHAVGRCRWPPGRRGLGHRSGPRWIPVGRLDSGSLPVRRRAVHAVESAVGRALAGHLGLVVVDGAGRRALGRLRRSVRSSPTSPAEPPKSIRYRARARSRPSSRTAKARCGRWPRSRCFTVRAAQWVRVPMSRATPRKCACTTSACREMDACWSRPSAVSSKRRAALGHSV